MALKISKDLGEIKPIRVETPGAFTKSAEYLIPFSTIREKVKDDQYLQIYIVDDEHGNVESAHLLIKEVRDETPEEIKKREHRMEKIRKDKEKGTYQTYLRLKKLYDNMTPQELKELQ